MLNIKKWFYIESIIYSLCERKASLLRKKFENLTWKDYITGERNQVEKCVKQRKILPAICMS